MSRPLAAPHPQANQVAKPMNNPAVNTALATPLMAARRSQGRMQSHGTVSGTGEEELKTALATGAKRLLFGKLANELARLAPEMSLHDVLIVAAEGRLLHGEAMAKALADAIHHRVYLTAEARPVLQLVLYELLSNAIEHGNLGLSSTRKAEVNEADWFEAYHATVKVELASPKGRIPILLTCRQAGSDLVVRIEDRGMGFAVRQQMLDMQKPEVPTGRGLALVFGLLNNRLTYSAGGRVVEFRLPTRPRQETSLLPSQAVMRAQAKVMVVDDQNTILQVVKQAFLGAGYQHVQVFQDGHAAMDAMRRQRPDVVLLDVLMPELDGFALCKMIKADPLLKDVPVLFLTSASDAQHRAQGFGLGAVDYVAKPVAPTELMTRCETHLMNGLMLQKLHQFAGRMQDDLARARNFQHDLLPAAEALTSLAAAHGLDLATIYQGCESLAGDYWTLLPLDADHVALCLVDFTGHGVVAALNTVQLHALLHSEDDLSNPVQVAKNLNSHLHALLGVASFATFVYGVLNTRTGALAYASGGAPPMFIRHANGKLTMLDCTGLPLGLDATIEVLPRRAALAPGDTLLMVSDGLTDSPHHGTMCNGVCDLTHERWGIEGLQSVLQSLPRALSASELLTQMLDAFYATVNLPVPDDLTAVAIRLK